jgi:hypothetical protein
MAHGAGPKNEPLEQPRLVGGHANVHGTTGRTRQSLKKGGNTPTSSVTSSDILKVSRESGAKTVLNTVAVNLRNCPPFASAEKSDPAGRGKMEQLRREAATAESQSDLREAIKRLEEAVLLDPK